MPWYQHVEGSTTTGSTTQGFTTQGFTTRGSTTLAPEHLDELISEVQYTCRRGIDERLGIFGMSEAQRQALRVIHGHPGLSQRQLARLMDQSEQAFSTLLARLLVRGYLVRRRADGRAVHHELSALGRIMLQDATGIAHEVLALVFAPLTGEEQRSVQALLQKVLNARWRLRFLPRPESPW